MASGNDARIVFSKETTYGTRVAPARAIPVNGEEMSYSYGKYYSPVLGLGRWARPSVRTTGSGTGSFNGDVFNTGFSYLLDGLHNNTTTPVQQGATSAYLHTHTLSTPPGKSYSAQVQMPPVHSSTLVPEDLVGVMFTGITFSWDAAGVLKYSISTVQRALDLAQSLVAYTPPTLVSPFPFQGGSLTIGGVDVADINGGGSLAIAFAMRTDAFPLGTSGLMSKPVETEKPTVTLTTTADFDDHTHLNRVINNTVSDVILRFEGDTISGSHKYYCEIEVPDMATDTDRPTVSGPGPVEQGISLSNASTDGSPPIIRYMTTDTTA